MNATFRVFGDDIEGATLALKEYLQSPFGTLDGTEVTVEDYLYTHKDTDQREISDIGVHQVIPDSTWIVPDEIIAESHPLAVSLMSIKYNNPEIHVAQEQINSAIIQYMGQLTLFE